MSDPFTTVGEAARAKLDSGDGEWLTPEAVYAYYQEHDPNPVAPVVLSWHIQNDVESFDTKLIPDPANPVQQIPVVSRKCVERFIEQRRKGRKVLDEPIESAPKYRPEPRQPTEPTGRTLTVTEAYKLYRGTVQNPMSLSWFRARLVDGTLTALKADEQHTAGRAVWLVDADDLQNYCTTDRCLETTPRERWYSLSEGFSTGRRHKIIPLTVSESAFRRLVYDGKISAERDGPGKRPRFKLTRKAMEDYFLEGKEPVVPEDTEPSLRPTEAYEYYCTKTDDPITVSEFWRLVDQGIIRSARASPSRNAPKLIARAEVDAFLAAPPKPDDDEGDAEAHLVPEPEWMTPEEVAALVRVDTDDIRHAFDNGELPGKKIGRKLRFARADVLKWLA